MMTTDADKTITKTDLLTFMSEKTREIFMDKSQMSIDEMFDLFILQAGAASLRNSSPTVLIASSFELGYWLREMEMGMEQTNA